MRVRDAAGTAGLAALRAGLDSALVALDFDGTLAPIVPDPTTSRLAPGGLAVLRSLAARAGRLAIVTGRPAAAVVELGELDLVPGILVEGQYGAESWQGGRLRSREPEPGLATIRAALPGILADADPGVWVEEKGIALGIHTRRAANPAAALAAIRDRLVALAESGGMEGYVGRDVVEIRPRHFSKGDVVRALAGRYSPSAVLFAGDDVGDLSAFDAVQSLRAQGIPGVTVCSASSEAPEVAERADVVLDGPAAVVEFLAGLGA